MMATGRAGNRDVGRREDGAWLPGHPLVAQRTTTALQGDFVNAAAVRCGAKQPLCVVNL